MDTKYYDCKICIDEAKEPVVTQCGHLYCWKCIFEWSQNRKETKVPCPICKAEVDIEKVIPLYCGKEEHDKKYKEMPKRPQANYN
jgi:E3 ubiquitin-protein ligase RNF5